MSKAKYRTEKEDYVIYAFTSPVDQKCFVWRCRKESIRDTYRFHKNFQRYFSERFMHAIEPHRPCMHVLEEVPQVTEVRTYRYVLAWIRIFMEHGYTCYNYQELLDQANDMQWTTKKLYDARKDECLDELLSCERCQVRVYKRAQCPFLENEIDE
ncbi:MAG: hypothetical protein IKU45_06330 [Clostridia bacterium]|nr:hypothetical protein [Clostridia bacterium]